MDKEKEKIALGLKQKTPSPWQDVEAKYPVSSRHTGEVVNIMTYGAFVKLEPGIEGLVHISEMRWTKRINHPSELVSIGDKIEVQVLNINQRQAGNLAGHEAGAAEPVGQGGRALSAGHGHHRHGAQPDQLRRLHRDRGGHRRPAARQRHELGAQGQPSQRGRQQGRQGHLRRAERRSGAQARRPRPEADGQPTRGKATSPAAISRATVKKGKVTKLTNFGVFVELEPGLEGLLHISELADHKVESPEEVVKVGDEIEVKVLRVDAADRKIGLSRKRIGWEKDDEKEPLPGADPTAAPGAAAAAPARPQRELRGGTGSGGGQLIQMPDSGEKK